MNNTAQIVMAAALVAIVALLASIDAAIWQQTNAIMAEHEMDRKVMIASRTW